MDTEWHTGLQSSAVAVAALVQCGPQIDALDRLMAPSPDDGVIVLDTIDNKKEREQLWICNGNVTNIATDPRWVYKGV